MTLILGEVLKEKGITAVSLSQMMEAKGYTLSRVSIGNLLSGKHSPKLETLEQIADTIETPIQDLFSTTRKANSKPLFTKDQDGNFQQIGELYE